MTKAQETRKRLLDDFEFYAKHAVSIRTKDGEVIKFTLNRVQQKLLKAITEQYLQTGKIRVVILKARQQGLSTFVSAWLYWYLSQHAAKKGFVVAHVADSTKTLFDLYKRVHTLAPELLRPSTKYSSRRELTFDILDTGLTVATAGGEGIGRSETITHAHMSEIGFWPKATAAENLNGLLQTIPNTPDTAIFMESTANGMSGVFYNQWKAAVEGTSGYIPFFSPWFDSDEYREEVPNHFERTYEEEDLVKLYGLDNKQLMFRRRKIAQNGREAFFQEYPSTADEAFISSGRPVFNPDQIHKMLNVAKEPLYLMALEDTKFEKHARGELSVFHERDIKETYYIGADVAMGQKNGDFSVAQILDSKKRQVAVWRGHVHPDYFADVLYWLGLHYYESKIVVENNNHGILTAVRLGRDLSYGNIYTEVAEGQLEDVDSIKIGFSTNARTKPLIIDKLRGAMRENELEINDKVTLREMLSYVVTESGKMTAEEGLNDDCVMSLALCNHVHEGTFEPILVSDEYYTRAI